MEWPTHLPLVGGGGVSFYGKIPNFGILGIDRVEK